jgi:hypothetical protein
MVLRAWFRALGLLMDAPGDVLKPNLIFSLLVLAGLPVWLLAVALQAPQALLALLKVLSALWVWMAFSWLCFAQREGLESRAAAAGLKGMLVQWWKARAAERALSFLALALLWAWLWLAQAFYGDAAGPGSQSGALAAVGKASVAVLGLLLVLVQMPHFGVSARKKMNWKGEWKAAWLMGLGFIHHCVLALLSVLLMSGALAFVVGMGRLAGRLLWVPALFLPLFGAALIAAFLVCLSDEFLARSLGLPAPGRPSVRLGEWLRPWK